MKRVARLSNFKAVHEYAKKKGFPLTPTQVDAVKRTHFKRASNQRRKGSIFRHVRVRMQAGFFLPHEIYLHWMVNSWNKGRKSALVSGSKPWKEKFYQHINKLCKREKISREQAAAKMITDISSVIARLKREVEELKKMRKKDLLDEEEKVVLNGYNDHAQRVLFRLERTLPFLIEIIQKKK